MTNYNFYSDHIEVVFEGDVILDSRSCSMGRIIDELTYDLSICKFYPHIVSPSLLSSLFSFIDSISKFLHIDDDSIFTILRNHFFVIRRRNFGHFHVHFYTSK